MNPEPKNFAQFLTMIRIIWLEVRFPKNAVAAKNMIFYLTVDWRNQSRLHLFDDGSQHTNEGNLNEGMRDILYHGYSSLSYLDPPSAFILPPPPLACMSV